MNIKIGVIGATGYAGIETVRLLARHPHGELTRLISKSYTGRKISDIYPNLKGVCDMECTALDIDDIAASCELVFTALPHGASKNVIPALYEKGLRIIDLSGDYRYDDPKVYEEWYGESHNSTELLKKSVYGLVELHRDKIKDAEIIGTPGCYPTCAVLGLAPLAHSRLAHSFIIDAKTGITGAGRGLSVDNLYSELSENARAYKIGTHRHTSEIEQELSKLAGHKITVTFTPQVIPMKRGIIATIYANLNSDMSDSDIVNIYRKFYKDEYFIRIYDAGSLPEIKNTAGSNFADIGICVDKRTNRVVVVSCIDNLIKGTAGQAVQNMNIMYGLDEKSGIDIIGGYL